MTNSTPLASNRRFLRATPITLLLAIANAVVFVWMCLQGAGWFEPNPDVHISWGSNYGPLTTQGEWWRLGTAAFIHFGLIHVLMNCYALLVSGMTAERLFGSTYFFLMYVIAGVCGSLASLAWNPGVNSAGASGAIFGIFGATFAFASRKDSGLPIRLARLQRNSALVFALYSLFYGLVQPGIDNAAHLGGLAGGLAAGAVFATPLDAARRLTWSRGIAGALVGIALACLLLGWVLRDPARLAAEQGMRLDLLWFSEREVPTMQEYNQLVAAVNSRKLTARQFAALIETRVLPVWVETRRRLSRHVPPPASTLAPAHASYLRYVDARIEGFELKIIALRRGDAVLSARSEARLSEGDSLVQELRAADDLL